MCKGNVVHFFAGSEAKIRIFFAKIE